MYMLFRDTPNRRLGQAVDPNIHYIRRTYVGLIRDVKNYYRRAPKAVDSRNLFANMIQHVHIDDSLDDAAFAKRVEDQADGIIRNFGLVSAIHKGKIFTAGVTLGPQTEEVVISSYEWFDKNNLRRTWRDLVPVKYLYHTRTDTNLPLMNNTTQGRGYGVTVVNMPMLLIMYRYWVRQQQDAGVTQLENVYRFIGSCVLPNMLESYLDIAYFNRLAREALSIRNAKYPMPHPFYLTDMTPRLDKLAERTNTEAILKGIELEGLAWITPMVVKDNLFEVMQLPREPVTRQNEWALAMARLPFVKYLVTMVKRNQGYDRSQMNEVLIDLIEGSRDQVFSHLGNSDFVKSFRKQVDDLIADLR